MDKRSWLLIIILLLPIISFGTPGPGDGKDPAFKIVSNSYGSYIGIQRGAYTFLDLGFEYHWRKVRLSKPKLYSVGGGFEYNFGNNVLGYKVGAWYKVGRVNFTVGGYASYYTNFTDQRVGIGPAIGFRLLGFHILSGYNFTTGTEDFEEYNKLYIALRYYFPLENKIKFKKKKK